ncbi:branched-chain amino acid ABC transporter substrate-binding protein, partial [Escherichia coli]|nr:branched-chain amino acid ABC transporter substrate-binding protein [Escherichia coli]
DYLTFLGKYDPGANKADAIVTAGYVAAQLMVQVLRQCGDDLRRENVMKQAANLRDFRAAMLLPGIMVNTSSSDYRPIEGMQLVKFDGTRWVPFGPILNSESG